MECSLVSVLPFRNGWRAEFRMEVDGRRAKGKRLRKVVKADTERDAWVVAQGMAREMTIDAAETMSDLVEAYARSLCGGNVTTYTRDCYRRAARRAASYFDTYPISCGKFGETEAADYMTRRLGDGAAVNTVRHEISVIRMALRERDLPDPYKVVGLPDNRRKDGITNEKRERLEALLRAIQGPTALAAWLAYGCRLQVGEIAALSLDDAPMDRDELRIRNSVGHDGLLGPARRRRTVPIAGEPLRRLRTHELTAECRGGYLFGTTGSHASPHVLSRKWSAIARAAGISLSLNDLRRLGGGA